MSVGRSNSTRFHLSPTTAVAVPLVVVLSLILVTANRVSAAKDDRWWAKANMSNGCPVERPAFVHEREYLPSFPDTKPLTSAFVGYTPEAASKIASPSAPFGFFANWSVPDQPDGPLRRVFETRLKLGADRPSAGTAYISHDLPSSSVIWYLKVPARGEPAVTTLRNRTPLWMIGWSLV